MRNDNIKHPLERYVASINGLWVCFIMLAAHFIPFDGFGQNSTKKKLTAEDYSLWSSLRAEKLSENAKWISFSLNYETGSDSLFVINSKGTKTYAFPNGQKGEFIGDKWFITMCQKEELMIVNLLTAERETIPNAIKFDLGADTKDLIILKKGKDGKKQLEIKNTAGSKSIVINDIELYAYCRKTNAVAYCTASEKNTAIALLNLRDKTTVILPSTFKSCEYSDIVWQENGSSIAFLQHLLGDDKKTKRTAVGYYNIAENKVYTFDPAIQDSFPHDVEITSSSFANLQIAPDGKRIFFGLQKTVSLVDSAKIQVWNADDKTIYPSKIQIDDWNNIAKAAVWWPQENRFSRITDNEFPKMMLNTNQTHALLFNPLQHEPQSNFDAPVDFYILDLSTGEKKLVLEDQKGINGSVSISVYKKHIVYFKNKQWWMYDITSGVHRNLTKDLGTVFSDEESDWPEEAPPYGNPGWNEEENTLFLYDKYDIWCIALDGSNPFRLTRGREAETIYRMMPQSRDQSIKMNYDGNYKGQFHINDRLVIKTEELERKGYCFWNKKTGLQQLINKKMRIPQFIASEKNNSYIYTEENFNSPPKLISKENQNAKEKVLFQSNPQHIKYSWGTSKLVSYTNSRGINLNGILYYPADYQSDKKYPLIVHVYEKQTKDLYKYIKPSENNPTGFNIANFTSKGYFVLLPDIVYEAGNPGSSAADCVISATKKSIASESIDSTRIGIIGHSYGGYETDFIITQTNMFAAAVAGAAITDFVSGYLYVAKNMEKPNFWQYEFGQLRIGKSLYDDYAGYLQNSPIYHADKVNTPLLSWAGEQDYHVHYYQSIEFYLALRRLGKTNTMLLYPGESHILSKSTDQKHLTNSIEKWFDYYLKEDNKVKKTEVFKNSTN
jgi:dipeptidyl aminopeptidase/acylaminoacyl peptidase